MRAGIRSFWLFPKKRRRRRTGSDAVGSMALLTFFACCLAGGLAFLALILSSLVIPEWRVNNRFRPVTCRIVDKKVEETTDQGSVNYRPRLQVEYVVGDQSFRPWTYDVGGVYSASRDEQQAVLDQYQVGATYPAWYDPAEPGRAVLVRSYTWFAWLMLLLPTSFISVGGGGMIYTLLNRGKSVERRKAEHPLPVARDLLEPLALTEELPSHPTIPRDRHLTNSPGTTLRFRLPGRSHPAWMLGFLFGATLVVGTAAAIFSWMAGELILAGEPDWFLTLFCLPWIAVGAILAFQFARRAWFQLEVGPTIVEISDHPLVLGERYRVLVAQAGRRTIQSLRLLLVCQERATFQQGTNTRTEKRRVYQQEVLSRQLLASRPGEAATVEGELELPEAAMHSFRAEHNEISWSLVVAGEAEGWPPFQREYPLVIYPAGAVLRRS